MEGAATMNSFAGHTKIKGSPRMPMMIRDNNSTVRCVRTAVSAKGAAVDREVLKMLEKMYKQGLPIRPAWTNPQVQGRPVKVAYQGVQGSYCHEAAVRAFHSCDGVPCQGALESAFHAVELDHADTAVLPLENSLDGVIERNYDLLLRHPRLKIAADVFLPINHCLLGAHDADIRRLRKVVSHPQALDHCRRRLSSLGVEIDAVENAAVAARFVSEHRILDTAVIGSRAAAKEFGMDTLEEQIQDDSSNTTRFLILARRDSAHRPRVAVSNSKTSVAFCLRRGTGDLHSVLSAFHDGGLVVSKIESRPYRENPVRVVSDKKCYFEYVFFVDFEAEPNSYGDVCVRQVVKRLEGFCSFLRVLGTYSTVSL